MAEFQACRWVAVRRNGVALGGGDAPGGVACGVLDSGPFRYRVGRGLPDEGVTMISRAQSSPASETATLAAFIEGFGQ